MLASNQARPSLITGMWHHEGNTCKTFPNFYLSEQEYAWFVTGVGIKPGPGHPLSLVCDIMRETHAKSFLIINLLHGCICFLLLLMLHQTRPSHLSSLVCDIMRETHEKSFLIINPLHGCICFLLLLMLASNQARPSLITGMWHHDGNPWDIFPNYQPSGQRYMLCWCYWYWHQTRAGHVSTLACNIMMDVTSWCKTIPNEICCPGGHWWYY